MKVLYIYSGNRDRRFSGEINKDYPDSQFYGLNFMKKFGIDAEFKEPGLLFNLGFNVRHFLMYFFTSGYDIVFGPALLPMMIFKKIFKPNRKFILLNISLIRTLRINSGWRKKLIIWLMKEFDAIVCLANSQVKYLNQHFPELSAKVFYVPLGIDVEFHIPGNRTDNSIISVGKDNSRDYKTVLDVAKKLPNESFRIICSPRNFEGISGVPSNVEVIFGQSIKELKSEYEKAKTILITTKDETYKEGADCSGQTVLLESMASGLPIIASKRESLEGYVEDNKEVLLVKFYDPVQIAEKIRQFNTEPGLASRLAQSARTKVENQFSSEIMAKNLSKIFRKVAENEK